MAGGTWEQCVREVTLSADPETVGSVGVGWSNLSSGLGYLRDALVGRSFVGPILPGTERPHTGGLPAMLAGWKGSGGDAYREHLGEIGKQIEDLITDAGNVSGALSRIEGDIRKAVSTIPVPLMDDFGFNEWSLPNGTELDDARDGESTSGFLAALRKDYQSNPASYADGAFRDKADDLEATMKVDGQAGDQKRGGWWDTKSHLDNWYRDNQNAATTAMSPLPVAVVTERPKLTLAAPNRGGADDFRPEDRNPPLGRPDIGGGGGSGIGGGGGSGIGGGPSIGSRPPGIGDIGGPTSGGGPFSTPATGEFGGGGSSSGGSSQFTPSLSGSGYPGGDDGYSSGLASAAPSGVGSLGGLGGGPGVGGAGLGGGLGGGSGLGGAGGGIGGGVGSAGGIGGGVGSAGGIGMGGIPGMVGGGNGKVPPMTSAAAALRNAAGAPGAGAGGARGGMAGAGVAGGGMMGGQGGAGHGGTGSDHSSWLTEDDDPWGSGDGASPGILR
ncbi:hypothetical protein [Micromonospora sp. 067-2]|uniref:hypothetical protein n=1 Tax=Micromonospora sp. 067-2 TaxID=2789270 RepID=UPI00397CDC42